MPVLDRRTLLTSLAAVAAAGPVGAQTRDRYGSPYGRDPYADIIADDETFYRGRLRRQRDPFFDPPEDAAPVEADPFAPAPRGRRQVQSEPVPTDEAADYRRIYAARPGEPFPVPAFNYTRVNPVYLRSVVDYRGREEPGTIVVDPRARHLYFVMGDGRAMRYGVGVGRQGFAWSGVATINSKQAWPDWYPPKEMIARDPRLARSLSQLQSGVGMHGGPRNPLGARAMYLWQNNRDTLYRIHGTVEPWTIGTSVSSGCIRMVNQDAIDLYERASIGARVLVIG